MGRVLEIGARCANAAWLMLALAGCGQPLIAPGAVEVKALTRADVRAIVETHAAGAMWTAEDEAQAAVAALRKDLKTESEQRGRTNISIGQIDGGTLVLAIGGGVLGIYLLRDTIKGGAFLKRLLGRNGCKGRKRK